MRNNSYRAGTSKSPTRNLTDLYSNFPYNPCLEHNSEQAGIWVFEKPVDECITRKSANIFYFGQVFLTLRTEENDALVKEPLSILSDD